MQTFLFEIEKILLTSRWKYEVGEVGKDGILVDIIRYRQKKDS